MAEERVTIQVRLSEEARDGLHQFCFDHGVTLTTLIEMLGRQMATGHIDVDEVIQSARRMDYERRNKRWSR